MQVKYINIMALLSLAGCSSAPTKPPIMVDKSYYLSGENVQNIPVQLAPPPPQIMQKQVYPPVAPPIKIDSSIQWYPPVTAKILYKFNKNHTGLSFDTHEGQTVHAIRSGKVVQIEGDQKQGRTITIRHPLGFRSVYQHVRYLSVELDDEVAKGQIIARTNNQLFYFEMDKFEKAINPQKYLFQY